MSLPVVCTVAGSDSGAGAGIQADLKTFAACGVYGASVVVALTAQNTVAVRAVELASPQMVAAQIDAVAEDLPPAAWKTGMLGSAEIVATVSERLGHHGAERVVVDPVIVATSGERLLDSDAVAVLRRQLLTLAMVITPNVAEAEVLLGHPIHGIDAVRWAAHALCELGPRVAVVKGGHLPGDEVTDVAYDAATGESVALVNERIPGPQRHGTGCTLSAAIAAFLARGTAPLDAVSSARAYLQQALLRAPRLGSGHGPLGHHWSEPAPVVPAVPSG